MSTILEMRGIEKTFPGVKVLNNVNLVVSTGEIHAVVGENGAGKSTLMKVLSGIYPHGTYSGDIVYQEQTREFKDIVDSESVGIIIHQELALVPLLSITENLFLGNEQARSGVIDWELSCAKARELLAKVGLQDPTSTLITNLGIGKQQLIEIAKALSKEVKLLILDEPTASLNESDSDALLELLLELKAQGISSILISNKLNEISKVADSITVLRDGTTVDTFDCRKEPISEDRIIQNMVGREMADRYPKREPQIGETIFEVRQWRVHHPIHPDMAEVGNMGLPPKLLAQGVKDMVRISDARMSGTAYGTVVLHVAPEAAAGGPLGIVQDGDSGSTWIAPSGVCIWTLATKKWRSVRPRAEKLAQVKPAMQGGYQSLYIDRVLQADDGCDFDFLVGCRGAAVPKHSH